MKPTTTAGFSMSPVQIDQLPGLEDVLPELMPPLKRAVEQAITDACDPRTRAVAPRKVTLQLSCQPDADEETAQWAVKKLSTALGGAKLPKPGRVIFKREGGVLAARALSREPEPEEMDDAQPVELGVSLVALLGGELELAFKRASIEMYLDIISPFKVRAHARTVTFEISVVGDEARDSVRLELSSPKITRAPSKKTAAQRLYLNRRGRKLVAQQEPDAHLPHGVGTQSTVDGTVVDINDRRSSS